MSCVLILIKKFFFFRLSKLPQRLRCSLYAFLSMSLFVLNFFFSKSWPFHDVFIYSFIYERSLICTNISLFYWSVFLNSLIKYCFEKIKLKVVVFRGHLRYSILIIRHRNIFIAAVCGIIVGFFFVENFNYRSCHFMKILQPSF